MGHIIGRVPFTDGSDRDVYEDADCRQYVQDDDGGKVYRTWLPPAYESDVVDGGAAPAQKLRGLNSESKGLQ
jgi:hypothetical protein